MTQLKSTINQIIKNRNILENIIPFYSDKINKESNPSLINLVSRFNKIMKTNKSFTKRLKITKNGKIKRMAAGRCHFNSKENNAAKMVKKKKMDFKISNKSKARFLPRSN